MLCSYILASKDDTTGYYHDMVLDSKVRYKEELFSLSLILIFLHPKSPSARLARMDIAPITLSHLALVREVSDMLPHCWFGLLIPWVMLVHYG